MIVIPTLTLCLAVAAAASGDPTLVDGEYGDHFEGDIVITQEERNGRPNKKWTANTVYYSMDGTVDSATRNTIQSAIAQYHSRTCVKWVQRSSQSAYVNFHRPASGCNSPVGMVGRQQTINLGRGCQGLGTIVHEMMHAIGFHHEHNREDRDSYVTIQWDNIQDNFKYAFNIARGTNTFGQAYDYSSIMHYNAKGFSKNGGYTIVPKDGNTSKIGQRNQLSTRDVAKINAMYNCQGTGGGTRTTTPRGTSGCTDTAQYVSNCRSYVQHNLCQKYDYFTKIHCKASCNMCGGTATNCVDNNQNCAYWSRAGECNRNPNYMLVYCKKSCGRCSG